MKRKFADMHCDSLYRAYFDGGDTLFNGDHMQSILKMHDAGQLLQFFAVFFPRWKETDMTPPYPSDEDYYQTVKEIFLQQTDLHRDLVGRALCVSDIRRNEAAGKSSAMLTLEDGRIVNASMERLEKLYEDGVRAISLTWNDANCFGYPNSDDPELMKKGLTQFGREAVAEMNRLGIIVDVSHLSDGGFYDVAAISQKPFAATHSNCRKLTPHQRNLTDEMIRILSEKGGVAGLNFCSPFVVPAGVPEFTKVEYLVNHVEHMYQTGGEDVIAIGSDFDGVDPTLELKDSTEMEKLFTALQKRGFSEDLLDKFAYKNVIRFLEDVIS